MQYPQAYNGNLPYIFVSYAHKDAQRVIPVISGLQKRGFRVWYDAGIEVATEWPEFIAQQLANSTCVVVFITKNSLESQNCRREINFAISLRKEPLVVYLEEVELSLGMQMQLGTLQALYHRRGSLEDLTSALERATLLAPCREDLVVPRKKASLGNSDPRSTMPLSNLKETPEMPIHTIAPSCAGTTRKMDIRTMQFEVNQIAAMCQVPGVKTLAEDLRYSDPVSSEQLQEQEMELSILVNQMKQAALYGNHNQVAMLCRKASAVLVERNRLCKMNKRSR